VLPVELPVTPPVAEGSSRWGRRTPGSFETTLGVGLGSFETTPDGGFEVVGSFETTLMERAFEATPAGLGPAEGRAPRGRLR
jgi:hypothetical protein